MNKIKLPSEWNPAEKMQFDFNTLNVIKSENNMLVSAGPGAGKTELLAQRASFLLETNNCRTPRKILALSYKVDAAKNLEKRIIERCGEQLSKRFVSKTYDSFAKGILDQFRYILPSFYRVNEGYEIGYERDVEAAFQKVSLPRDFIMSSFYKNTYLTEYKLPLVDTPYGEIAKNVWSVLLNGSKELTPKLTFKMIARLAEYLVRLNIPIQKSMQLTYSHIFLDEFQDTPVHHYDLIHTCFNNTGNIITAVGDKKQRIMLWAGAMPTVFEKFKDDFNAVENTLLINHRSAPNLIKLQKPIIKAMLGQELDVEFNSRWKGHEGESEIWIFDNDNDEADFLYKKVCYLIENGFQFKDICILVRQTPDRYTTNIIRYLKEKGIDIRIEETYQNLFKEEIIMFYIYLITLINNKQSPDEWILVSDTVKKIMGYSNRTSINKIYEIEKKIKDVLVQSEETLLKVTDFEGFKALLENIYNELNLELFCSIYPQYNKLAINQLIANFANLLWKEYEICFDWGLAIERLKGEQSIPIMSIHKCKGLEYKAVIVIGLEDGAFWNINRNFEEELCTFFVATSRAIEKIYFSYTERRNSYKNYKNKVNVLYDLLLESGVTCTHDFSNEYESECKSYFEGFAVKR
jgi:DNA helicase II / ATP-dependent DNA helicase PcrA